MNSKMTKDDALLVIIEAAKELCESLEDRIDFGPEGLEFHLKPRIAELKKAIRLIEKEL